MIDALERAAERGADVRVSLCEKPHGEAGMQDRNRHLARNLSDAGVKVTHEPPYGPSSHHDKIALINDKVFYSDRNWRADDSAFVLAMDVDDAFAPQTKANVISEEAALIRAGKGHDVLVSTESLGTGPIVDALIERAARGDRVRLIYNEGEQTAHLGDALDRLNAAGVELKASTQNHKFVCAGPRAWIGSANATMTAGATGVGAEWGAVLTGRLAAKLDAQAERLWDESNPPLHGHPRA